MRQTHIYVIWWTFSQWSLCHDLHCFVSFLKIVRRSLFLALTDIWLSILLNCHRTADRISNWLWWRCHSRGKLLQSFTPFVQIFGNLSFCCISFFHFLASHFLSCMEVKSLGQYWAFETELFNSLACTLLLKFYKQSKPFTLQFVMIVCC